MVFVHADPLGLGGGAQTERMDSFVFLTFLIVAVVVFVFVLSCLIEEQKSAYMTNKTAELFIERREVLSVCG